MKGIVRTLSAVLVVFLAGCTVGPSIDRLHALESGQGIEVALVGTTNPSRRHRFELLSAEDTGLYLRLIEAEVSDAIYWIPYQEIASAEFGAMPQLNFDDGREPTLGRKHDLRLVSRYPQGIDDELREALLRAYDQEEITTLK